MKDTREIVHTFEQRRLARNPIIEAARTIQRIYESDIVLPNPEVDGADVTAVANLLAVGIDQHAMRIASVLPGIEAPPIKLGSPRAEERARQRQRAGYGWWFTNDYDLKMKQRARWLVAYSDSPIQVEYGKDRQGNPMVRMRERDPLTCFPAPTTSVTEMVPADVIFATSRTVGWVVGTYPELVPVLAQVFKEQGAFRPDERIDQDMTVDLIEYLDDSERVLCLLGAGAYRGPLDIEAEYGINGAKIERLGAQGGGQGQRFAIELARTPNRVGMQTVVVPGRITLGKPKGQFDDSVPLYYLWARLAALEVNAVANAVWPDTWLVARPNETPQIVKPADGRAGQVGVVTGGDLRDMQINPGYQTYPTMDRLERAMRTSSVIPSDFTGESPTNVRTGARGAAILSASVDYFIQEAQQILARSMQHECEIAAAVEMAYSPGKPRSFYLKWKGASGRVDYTPRDIWGEDRTLLVSYAKAGADVNQLAVEVGMRLGQGTLSKRSGMKMDPMVFDVDAEEGQIVAEALTAAALASLQQQAASGALPLVDVARISELVEAGKTLTEAVQTAQKEAQARQAAQAPPQAPEAQPGLSQPGAGVEPPPTVGAPPPSMANLVQTLRGLRTSSQVAQGAA